MAALRVFEQATHASLYSKYRPTYPKDLLNIISRYITRHGGGHGVVVDVGCGTGQSTFYLLDLFKHCIGVDISKAQISEALRKCEVEGTKNIEFVVGSGLDMPVESSSVDMVTIAQAWHWVKDIDGFYSECKRVLKPGGSLAVYGYGNVQALNSSCDSLIRHFYADTLKGFWHKERRYIDDKYAEVVLPFSNVERHDSSMEKLFSLSDFIGYLSSWSGYQKYCEVNPENTVLNQLQEKLKSCLERDCDTKDNKNLCLETRFPLFIILGQK